MRIIYIPLEPYEERYTLQLRQWMLDALHTSGLDFIVVDGNELYNTSKIKTGVVLDAHARTFYALSQSMHLVAMHKAGSLTEDDFIYFEDMFHPGIESLAYIFDLSHKPKPKIGVRCLAQTIDPDDFVHYTGMHHWMRHYERMVNAFVDIVFINSSEMLSFMTAAGWDVPVVVTGVPFGLAEVRSRTKTTTFNDRPRRVSFASRTSNEKQPEFFLAVAKEYKRIYGNTAIFDFLSGNKINSVAVDRAAINGLVEVYPCLSKNEYYRRLGNETRVLFNSSLQDWGSVVMPEADALGCNILFPAYHSFPEILDNDYSRMYIPWSVEDAVEKLFNLIHSPHPRQGEVAEKQDRAIAFSLGVINEIMSSGDTPAAIYPLNTSYRRLITERAIRNYL